MNKSHRHDAEQKKPDTHTHKCHMVPFILTERWYREPAGFYIPYPNLYPGII